MCVSSNFTKGEKSYNQGIDLKHDKTKQFSINECQTLTPLHNSASDPIFECGLASDTTLLVDIISPFLFALLSIKSINDFHISSLLQGFSIQAFALF